MPSSSLGTAMRSSALTSRLSAPLCKKSTFTPNLPIFPVRHHSSTAPTARAAPSSIHSFRPRAPLQPSNLPIRCLSSPRYNSTATSTVDGASTSSATTAPVIPAITPLSWTDFFALRKRRRVTNLITSSLTGSMSLFVGAAFLSGAELDNLGAQKFGVDPFIFAGILTMACGSLGWLVGPFIGNTVWRMANRGRVTGFELKEKNFYDRIKRYRADPAIQSMSNLVPDYYGEKIGSVAAYRQWLKDQRAFTKKRQM